MKTGTRERCAGGWCGLMFGALVLACGPGAGSGSPEGEDAAEVSAPSTGPEGDSTRQLHREEYMPAPLARQGPVVAYGGGKFLVAWSDVRPGREYGTRVKPDGRVLDPEGIRFNTTDDSDFGSKPAIAYNGKNFMVVWRSSDGLSLVRVKPDGTLLEPPKLLVSSDDVFPPIDIACSSQVCMAVYEVSGDEDDFIHYTLVKPDGTVLVRSDYIGAIGQNPAVAWDGRQFLVVWEDPRLGSREVPDIFGARVKPDGTVLDPAGIPISVAPGAQGSPDVVWTGRRFLVAWQDARDGELDIYGARVRTSGAVDDPDGIPISTAPGEQRFPRLAHRDFRTLVVWEDTRVEPARVWGTRVTENGAVSEPSGFAVSRGDFAAEYQPDVAFGDNRFLVPYAASGDVEPREPHFILATRVKQDTTVEDSPALVLTLTPSGAQLSRTAPPGGPR